MLTLAFMQSINAFAKGQMVTAIGLAVLLLGIGTGVAARLDGRVGAVLMIAGLGFGLYVLKLNGIFNL